MEVAMPAAASEAVLDAASLAAAQDHNHHAHHQHRHFAHVAHHGHLGHHAHHAHHVQLQLKDVAQLVRLNAVGAPTGFTRHGCPVLYLPSGVSFTAVPESDLHLLFKYLLSVVPRTQQANGFALVVDRRHHDVGSVRSVFQRIVTLFPARIREVYLLYNEAATASSSSSTVSSQSASSAVAGDSQELIARIIDDFLLDFDIFHVRDVNELQHYIDPKCLPCELGGQVSSDVEMWLTLQEHVESFSFNARRIARKLAQFVGLLNAEDVDYRSEDTLKDVATKNRNSYRRLRKELEELTDHGLLMLKSLQRPDANVMQRLAVQVLCKQLDQAWTYFSRSWKMQDHVYAQYLELNAFQTRFRELSHVLAESERLMRDVPMTGNSSDEVSAALDRIDACAHKLAMDGVRARDLARLGQDILLQPGAASTAAAALPDPGLAFAAAADTVQPKCAELKTMCQKLETLLSEKRRLLLKFLELMESLEAVNKWCTSATQHLERTEASSTTTTMVTADEDVFSQIRQLDYLLSKSRELTLRSRRDFEDGFDSIKELMSAQTLFTVDDTLEQLDAVIARIMKKREELRNRAIRFDPRKTCSEDVLADLSNGLSLLGSSSDGSESAKLRRENILSELLSTEARYCDDLLQVRAHYFDKLSASNLTDTRVRARTIFGNLEEIHDFHSACLFPELERCGANPAAVARAFVSAADSLRVLYSHYCQNMSSARQAIADLGGETSPGSILVHCQQEAGHALPLSSYLLKPMQRLTKYQLLLRDLTESANVVCGRPELEEALAELLAVIRVVNDSMNDGNIKGLPETVRPLGMLCAQDVFQVTCENSSKSSSAPSQILFRNRSQRRYVFLHDNHVVFCKPINEKTKTFQFKFSLPTSVLGMSSIVKGDDKKLEVWVNGVAEQFYCMEAKSKKAKDDFSAELRKVIMRQKDQRQKSGTARVSARPLTRSRSLESNRAYAPLRSRSVDSRQQRAAAGRNNTDVSSDDNDCDGSDDVGVGRHRGVDDEHSGRYIVLADYMALTSREIDLSEDEIVELVKVGCAGWWYVRLTTYPYPEGWAPSTYLEKVPDHRRE